VRRLVELGLKAKAARSSAQRAILLSPSQSGND
jgi:hypothetical protein